MNVYWSLQRRLSSRLSRPLASLLGVLAASLWLSLPVWAQRLDPAVRDSFLSDPLTASPRDPLLPELKVERPLSPLELYALEQELDALNQEAQTLLAAGQPMAAFEQWRREVRLRRLLGTEAELAAIERIAPLAWSAQQSVDLQLLALRLRQIWQPQLADKVVLDLDETPTASPLGDEQLVRLASVFQTLRDGNAAIAIYQQLVERAGRPTVRLARLTQLAGLQQQWFRFAAAAENYQTLAAAADDAEQQMEFLKQLAYSAQQAEDYAQAIAAQTQLLRRYRQLGLAEQEAPVEIAIAQNYRRLRQFEPALTYYRLAYRTAQQLAQFGYSATVLKELGELYVERGQLNEAITMYNLLVRVEQQSYNYYGVMHAYDQLGQIYRTQGNVANAIAAFEAGLRFAEQLDYQQDYFREQLSALRTG
ncbi:MAG: tetratricopeptide repeat protein [Leptolyngbya sp. SIO4C1]|nr:tetratricopeptide repeat protein [Leptolyngbya sp. SIO4C1]